MGRAQGNHHPSISPYGLFRCADGSVQIAVGSEGLWQQFCAGFGIDPAPPVWRRTRIGWPTGTGSSSWWRGPSPLPTPRPAGRLADVGVPAGKVRTLDEVYEWEQTRSQGLLIDVEHATLGQLHAARSPLRFFDADGAEVTRRGHAAPPTLDQDGAAIRAWLGRD